MENGLRWLVVAAVRGGTGTEGLLSKVGGLILWMFSVDLFCRLKCVEMERLLRAREERKGEPGPESGDGVREDDMRVL